MPTSSFSFTQVTDLEWMKLRQLEGVLVDDHFFPYVMKTLPPDIMHLAMVDCLPEDLPEEIDKEELFKQFLIHWILFNWIPDEDFGLKNFNAELTIAENYLQNYREELGNQEIRFIETIITTFYSFYAILEVEKEKSLLVKDILLGTEHRIKERQGTYHLKRGDIVFSRILTMENQSIFVGMAPFTIPMQNHMALLDLKNYLIEENDDKPLDSHVIRNDFDLVLYDYFFDGLIAAYKKPSRTLLNTDGDLFQLTTSHFKLSMSPEETLNRLISMTLSNNPEEFLQDAKRTRAGKISEIQLPWLKKGNKKHKDWDNTLFGDVIIKPGKLILKTNSSERAEKGKKLLSKLLGDAIEFQKMLVESIEQSMKSITKASAAQNNESETNLMGMPEVQEQMKTMAKAHWENWFDTQVPALENKTPREAAKTKQGREQLESLLLYYERMDDTRDKNDPFKADIDFIKTALKLKK